LDEALAHKTVGVRLAACRAIADVAGMAMMGLSATLAAHLERLTGYDQAPAVRISARLALEAAGPNVSHGEVPSKA
jgi:hypothetical protein